MGTNLLQPYGLQFNRNQISGANTYQANLMTIKKGYATNLGKGDLVKTGTGGNQGYAVLGQIDDVALMGVFQSVLPYYDATLQGISHGLNGSYQATANPNADVQALVVQDPFATFIAQVSGGPFAQSWVGQNINFLAGTNGVPNIAGISTLVLDAASIGVTNTLPLKIIGTVGVLGGPQDPTNTNPWIEVRLNTAEMLAAGGF